MTDEPKLTLSEGWEFYGHRKPTKGEWFIDSDGNPMRCDDEYWVERDVTWLILRPISPERRFERWLEEQERSWSQGAATRPEGPSDEVRHRMAGRCVEAFEALCKFREVFNLEGPDEA